jgi:hypothetical protein
MGNLYDRRVGTSDENIRGHIYRPNGTSDEYRWTLKHWYSEIDPPDLMDTGVAMSPNDAFKALYRSIRGFDLEPQG